MHSKDGWYDANTAMKKKSKTLKKIDEGNLPSGKLKMQRNMTQTKPEETIEMVALTIQTAENLRSPAKKMKKK
jgi:hypothetical protein